MSWRDDIFEDDDTSPPSFGRGVKGKVTPPREDNDRRASPNPQTYRGETKLHWEYMEKGKIRDGNPSELRIDIDREGGVFLDHGELARILAGNKAEMIKQINEKIEDAQESYKNNEAADPTFYLVKT